MSVFKDLLNLWRADDLLSQAWKDSYEMMNLSREIFVQAIKMLREQSNIATVKALKKRDKEINEYQQTVRRKVMTHYAVNRGETDLESGMVLVNIVVDIERVGDYTKNILDLALNYPEAIISEKLSEDLHLIESEMASRFDKTLEAIHTQDPEVAQALISSYREQVNSISDEIVKWHSRRQVSLWFRIQNRGRGPICPLP
ncbi:MAG: PhoU domain-containing protein [FCB group bacterium]|nr:PhoU domain-containing protein [FCB group bacterium]